MPENKGKPSGKFAENKSSPGRKGGYQRTGWPEDANLQREQPGAHPPVEGRNKKEGGPR